jgi:hypothetical protein
MRPLVCVICCLLSISTFSRQLSLDSARAEQMNKIFREEVIPFLEAQDSIPNWSVFGKHIIALYGDPGEEILLFSQTVYSMQQDHWTNFSEAILPYLVKYSPSISLKYIHYFSQYMRRNAMLLYQCGQVDEGIKWQTIALALAAREDQPAILEDLEKMKRRE